MGSDKARNSFNEKQQYRSVVMQQGRVTVEADWNEAQEIAGEETRREALDFVGPSGTPDDGYAVVVTGAAPTPPFDFSVGPGTMYVGGVRAQLGQAVAYSQQPEWLDNWNDPDWVSMQQLGATPPQRELVYLSLREQEVSAVEDADLRDVALGGPDTAARLRLIQHVARFGTNETDCQAALAGVEQARWNAEGLALDRRTLRLESQATLQLSFLSTNVNPNDCEPAASGGYLGADNQLIRVQVVSFDQAKNTGRLVWGYDNASFLYRCGVVSSTLLSLESSPVDSFHQPRKDQAVEVLGPAAQLSNGEYVAAPSGFVTTLSAPYAADTRNLSLTAALPPAYGDGTPAHPSPPRLFLRVWEEELDFAPGAAVTLGTTGLQVTLQTSGGALFHAGDYWQVAVRPSTPTKVYPQRYLDAPQPPDGPRLWACPLALVGWTDGVLSVLDDCRNPFDNLVDLSRSKLGGCCNVTVWPEDVTGGNSLQSIIDRLTERRGGPTACTRSEVKVCLMPGCYSLREPLRLEARHSNLTLEGCHDGAVIQALEGSEESFLDGLVVLDRADNVTLSGLRFKLPLVQFRKAGGRMPNLDPAILKELGGPQLELLKVSVGLRPVHCANLSVEDCLFRFSLGGAQEVFGVGILANSECWGLKIRRTRFLREEAYLRAGQPQRFRDASAFKDGVRREGAFRLLVGYALSPSLTQRHAQRPGFDRAQVAEVAAGAQAQASAEQVAQGQAAGPGAVFEQVQGGIEAAELQQPEKAPTQGKQPDNRLLAATFDKISQTEAALGRSPVNAAAAPPPRWASIRSLLHDASFEENVFAGLSIATMINAQCGAVSYEGNAVRECVGGLSIHWLPNLTLAGIQKLNRQAGLLQYATGRLIILATLLTVNYPLPRDFDPKKELVLAGRHRTRLKPSLRIADNEIDAFVAKGVSGFGLIVGFTNQSAGSRLMLTANKIRTRRSRMPTAIISRVERFTMTGNLIFNEHEAAPNESFQSLLVEPLSQNFEPKIAVTGNVFEGNTNLSALPPRAGFMPPFDKWNIANTEF